MPALVSPRLMTSTAATVMTAGWPMPLKASLAGTMPATTTASKERTATMS
jgi:hypothetical protein